MVVAQRKEIRPIMIGAKILKDYIESDVKADKIWLDMPEGVFQNKKYFGADTSDSC